MTITRLQSVSPSAGGAISILPSSFLPFIPPSLFFFLLRRHLSVVVPTAASTAVRGGTRGSQNGRTDRRQWRTESEADFKNTEGKFCGNRFSGDFYISTSPGENLVRDSSNSCQNIMAPSTAPGNLFPQPEILSPTYYLCLIFWTQVVRLLLLKSLKGPVMLQLLLLLRLLGRGGVVGRADLLEAAVVGRRGGPLRGRHPRHDAHVLDPRRHAGRRGRRSRRGRGGHGGGGRLAGPDSVRGHCRRSRLGDDWVNPLEGPPAKIKINRSGKRGTSPQPLNTNFRSMGVVIW